MSDRFGEVAASMFVEQQVAMRGFEWAEVLRVLHASPGGSESTAFRLLSEAFNAQRAPTSNPS